MNENKALFEETKKITVKIYGETYILKTRDSEEYADTLASKLDAKMCEIAEKNPKLSPYRVAVLAALNMADELERANNRYAELLNVSEKI